MLQTGCELFDVQVFDIYYSLKSAFSPQRLKARVRLNVMGAPGRRLAPYSRSAYAVNSNALLSPR